MLFTTFVLLDIAEDKVTSVTEGIAGVATPKDAQGRLRFESGVVGGPRCEFECAGRLLGGFR